MNLHPGLNASGSIELADFCDIESWLAVDGSVSLLGSFGRAPVSLGPDISVDVAVGDCGLKRSNPLSSADLPLSSWYDRAVNEIAVG